MGIGHRMYYGETSIDFVGKARRWFLLSGIVLLAGVISLSTRGLNFGIEFQGGTAWEMSNVDVDVDEAREVLRPLGLGNSTIQVIGGTTIRVQAEPEDPETVAAVRQELADLAGIEPGQVSLSEIGPSWGETITEKAQRALVLFFLAVALYISFRFEWKMAFTALLALFHDILVTVGIYSLSGFEVTPVTVIAFLTIMGFSLYDSIIIFDKVDENTKGLAATGRLTYSATVNLSTNQMLMRSVNTSIVAILPILSVLVVGAFILGATTLQDFGLSMFIGMSVGMYSSLFIVPPVLAWLKEREDRYSSIRRRLQARGDVRTAPLTPAAAASSRGAGAKVSPPAPRPVATAAPDTTVTSVPTIEAAPDAPVSADSGDDTGEPHADQAPERPAPAKPRPPVTPRGRKKKRRR
ncbi:MAG: protein translocase subunit SecF [Actinobacteria bacterium]|nr:protein translocase subunit SecF [Actinomycetota bacterium]